MQSHHFCLLLSLLLITIASAAADIGELPPKLPPQPLPGGYTPIKNLSDPHVIDVAKFALKQHNKKYPAYKLRLVKIIEGWSQVVSGINWKLIIYAKHVHSHYAKRYEAVVYEIPWKNFMNVTSFQPV